jgi:hypothetical protein
MTKETERMERLHKAADAVAFRKAEYQQAMTTLGDAQEAFSEAKQALDCAKSDLKREAASLAGLGEYEL